MLAVTMRHLTSYMNQSAILNGDLYFQTKCLQVREQLEPILPSFIAALLLHNFQVLRRNQQLKV